MSALEALDRLPSVTQLVRRWAGDLSQRVSLLVLLPDGLDPADAWPMLRRALSERGISAAEVRLSELAPGPPSAALGAGLGWLGDDGATPATPDALMDAGARGAEVIWLDGVDALNQTDLGRWLGLLPRWAEVSQRRANRGAPVTALCLLAPACALPDGPPPGDLYLGVRHWWGLPSLLELRLLCRYREDRPPGEAAARWREAVLPALAVGDPALVDELWEDAAADVNLLEQRLLAYAHRRDWTAERLRQWGADRLNASPMPRQLAAGEPWIAARDLWAQGAATWTPEGGLELHSAALAALGRRARIRHRVWRGQVDLILPMIDDVRVSLCTQLTEAYGPEWPVMWGPPQLDAEREAVLHDPFACQLGHLRYVLGATPTRDPQSQALAETMLSLRNELAHYRPVGFYQFHQLLALVQRWRQRQAGPQPRR